MKYLWVTLLALVTACLARGNEKWLFLGDSITQAGWYVDYIETWLLLNEPDPPEIVSLGLSSETVSGLTEPDHPFPRPWLHDRLDRVLDRVEPDVVFACYGMNCAIYHPFSEERFRKYRDGVERLVAQVREAGAVMILVTPPPFAGRVVEWPTAGPGETFGYRRVTEDYNEVLAKYSEWVLSLDGQDGVRAITLRPPLERFMEASYIRDPIHPTRYGHELMAEALLSGLGYETGADILDTGVSRRAAEPGWAEVFELVGRQRAGYEMSLLKDIGHANPNVNARETMPLEEARVENEMLTDKINAWIKDRPGLN